MTRYLVGDPQELRLSVSAVVWRRAGHAREPGDSGETEEDAPGGGPRAPEEGSRTAPGRRELLLMRRSDNGHWGLPGGYVEPGESVSEAVAREVLEETGVAIRPGRLVGVYSDPARQVVEYPDGRRVQAVNLCFEALPVGEPGRPTTPHETLATGYFPHDALPEPFVPIHAVRVADAAAGHEGVRVR